MHGPSLARWLITPRRDCNGGRTPRDSRVDFVRGLALLVIFVTHVPGNPFAKLMPGAFFFHDAADVFVLLAGFAVAVAFGSLFESRGFLVGTARVGARVLQLYGAHLLTFLFAAGLIAWAATTFEDPLYFEAVNILPLFTETERSLVWALLLVFQPSYLDILPLYIVLLASFPLISLGMRVAPVVVLAASAALWLFIQLTGLNLPNFGINGGWFFNPLAWQLLFVLGALAGYAVRDGVCLPRSDWAVRTVAAIALGLVVFKACMGHVPLLLFLEALPPDWHISWDKTFLSLWRVAELLCGAYLVAALVSPEAPWFEAAPARALVTVGRHSLVVFSVGIVASMTGHLVLVETDRAWAAIAFVNAAGIAGLIGLAHAIEWYGRAVSSSRATPNPVQVAGTLGRASA